MTQVNLPKTNQTGVNEWADVEDNDQALATVINGQLDNDNLSGSAGITGANIANSTITRAKLAATSLQTARDSFTVAFGVSARTITWPTPFADANYTVAATVQTNSPTSDDQAVVTSQSATQTVVQVRAGGSVTLHVIAIHD